MNIDRIVFGVSGALILLSLILGYTHSEYWFLLTALIGLEMFQAAFSRYNALAKVLKFLGVRPGPAFE